MYCRWNIHDQILWTLGIIALDFSFPDLILQSADSIISSKNKIHGIYQQKLKNGVYNLHFVALYDMFKSILKGILHMPSKV